MKTKTRRVEFLLDDAEYGKLKHKAAKSGLPLSTYIRHLIDGLEPQDKPPPDYYRMMEEIRAVGQTLRDIAADARRYGSANADKYDEVVQKHLNTMLGVIDAATMPRRRET